MQTDNVGLVPIEKALQHVFSVAVIANLDALFHRARRAIVLAVVLVLLLLITVQRVDPLDRR